MTNDGVIATFAALAGILGVKVATDGIRGRYDDARREPDPDPGVATLRHEVRPGAPVVVGVRRAPEEDRVIDDGRLLALAGAAAARGSSLATRGSPGIVRRGRALDALSPTEGMFVPWKTEPSSILVGPVRNVRDRKRIVRLTDQEMNDTIADTIAEAMTSYRNPGTAVRVARSNPRSNRPREAAIAVARDDTVSEPRFRGYHVVVFRAAVEYRENLFEATRLEPAINWIDPYRNEALNDADAKEASRRWLIEVFEEAWAKGRADTPHLLRKQGSRGVVRAGRTKEPLCTPESAIETVMGGRIRDLTAQQAHDWKNRSWPSCPHGTDEWVLVQLMASSWRYPELGQGELLVPADRDTHDLGGRYFGECWCDLDPQPENLKYHRFWVPEGLSVEFV